MHQLGFHGFGIDLPDRHAACGDDGLLHRTAAADFHRECLGELQEPAALGAGHGVGAGLRRDAGALHHHRNQQPGVEILQGMLNGAVLILFKVTQDPKIQLLLIQRGLEIDENSMKIAWLSMGAGTENHGAGQTEMGEEQLPKVLINSLPRLIFHLDGAVSKGKPLEPGTEIAILLQRHQ